MAFKPVPRVRTKTKYHLYAVYKLWAKEKMVNSFHESLEECHKWLEEHKTHRVETGIGSWHNAILISYYIYKITEIRESVEKKTFELDK